VKVLGGVLVLRRIAAADMAANHTEPQVNPSIAGFQALLATVRMRLDVSNLVRVGTGFHAFPSKSSFILEQKRSRAGWLSGCGPGSGGGIGLGIAIDADA
jgi:hypothetical protein